MKITQGHFQPVQTTGVSSTKSSLASSDTSPLRTPATVAIDPVLGDAQSQLKTLPEVDKVKVAEMKQALSEGKLTINLDELTVAIQQFFKR